MRSPTNVALGKSESLEAEPPAIVRMLMHRDIVNADTNSLRIDGRDDLVPSHRNLFQL